MKPRWRNVAPWILLSLYITCVGARLLRTGWNIGTSSAIACLTVLLAAHYVISPRSEWLAGARARPTPASSAATDPVDPAADAPAAYIQSRGL